ncbi:MAG: serine/threonine-protein kinase, partial [Myxococcota bacterium]
MSSPSSLPPGDTLATSGPPALLDGPEAEDIRSLITEVRHELSLLRGTARKLKDDVVRASGPPGSNLARNDALDAPSVARGLGAVDDRAATILASVEALGWALLGRATEEVEDTQPYGQPATAANGPETLADTWRHRPVALDLREVVDDSYQIEAVIGRGGMGTVYRARDLRLSRPVALKVVASAAWEGDHARDTFVHEARALARVRHPNIVTVHAVGLHRGHPFIVMDLIDGCSLRVVARREPPTVTRALHLVDQLCQGLDALHQAGLVHRDIKPSNLLVDRRDQLYIADLGLAWPMAGGAYGAHPATGGTPGYSAPEVFACTSGESYGPATD